MQDYDKQLTKFLTKRDAVLKRMAEDSAECDKLNARIAELQLAKIRAALGCDEKELLEIISKNPEQLEKLREGTVVSNTDSSDDADEVIGQTTLFDNKHKPYSD